MDIVGKFSMAPRKKVFLLIVTDYFSKWVEPEALSRITYLQIRKFLWTYVITRFGVPHEIVTDNGPQFTSHNFKEFWKDWGIKLTFATPRHPSLTNKPSPRTKPWSTCLKSDWRALTGNGQKYYTEFYGPTEPLPKQQQGKLPTRWSMALRPLYLQRCT